MEEIFFNEKEGRHQCVVVLETGRPIPVRHKQAPSPEGLEDIMSIQPRPVTHTHNTDRIKEGFPLLRCLMHFEKIPIENNCNERSQSLISLALPLSAWSHSAATPENRRFSSSPKYLRSTLFTYTQLIPSL